MREIILDGRDMDNRAQLHQQLREKLDLPDHYGRNLDALNDCLGELRDVRITLRYAQAMVNSLGAYGLQVLEVFRQAQQGRADLRFTASDQ